MPGDLTKLITNCYASSFPSLKRVDNLASSFTDKDRERLIDTIIVKTQGFVNGNFADIGSDPVGLFREMLKPFSGISKNDLRNNLRYFLKAVMPVCDEYGINLCIHPDDPPMPVLGLPRIVSSAEDIDWILKAVDNPHNGLTFCAGSLSSGAHNDVVGMASKFTSRIRFVHLRSCDVLPGGNFVEVSHTAGRAQLVELIRIFECLDPALPMRLDHGRTILGDAACGYNPGYSFHGRMLALGQVDGMIAAVRNEIENKMI